MGIVEDDVVETLDGVHVTRSVGEGVLIAVSTAVGDIGAVMAKDEDTFTLTSIARGTTTEDGTLEVHVVGSRLVVAVSAVALTINIDVGVA